MAKKTDTDPTPEESAAPAPSPLQELIKAKVAAGLPADQAREVAERQLAHDAALAAAESGKK